MTRYKKKESLYSIIYLHRIRRVIPTKLTDKMIPFEIKYFFTMV